MTKTKTKKILQALDVVQGLYGFETQERLFAHDEPLDGLILTVLSQNTNDRNRDRAFECLKKARPTWEAVARTDAPAIAELIRVAGLGETKSARILTILETIHGDFGAYSLVAMKKWDAARAREYLLALPGVGPKTAACVLIFDLELPAFPVDTHIARISRRLGWVEPKATPEKIQEFLESLVPPERCRGAHVNLIEFGRQICRARGALCASCPLGTTCPSCGKV